MIFAIIALIFVLLIAGAALIFVYKNSAGKTSEILDASFDAWRNNELDITDFDVQIQHGSVDDIFAKFQKNEGDGYLALPEINTAVQEVAQIMQKPLRQRAVEKNNAALAVTAEQAAMAEDDAGAAPLATENVVAAEAVEAVEAAAFAADGAAADEAEVGDEIAAGGAQKDTPVLAASETELASEAAKDEVQEGTDELPAEADEILTAGSAELSEK